MNRIVITGSDTDIGKTTFSAALMLGLEAAGMNPHYWKPVQSGVTDGIDTRTVQDHTGLPDERFLPEMYKFSTALSPHRSAEIDNAKIDIAKMENKDNIPSCDGTLLIEGAGGLHVPLTREYLQIDLYQNWQTPVILCVRTGLGTINHSLLSVEALKSRNIPIKGLVFIGDKNVDNVQTIAAFSKAKILGIMPKLEDVTRNNLKQAFATNFISQDFK